MKNYVILFYVCLAMISLTQAQQNSMTYDFARFSGSNGGDDGKVVLYETVGTAISHIYEIGLFSNTCNFPALSTTAASNGGFDIYMIRYDASGNPEMLWTWGTATNDVPYSAAIVPNGGNFDVYIGGYFSNSNILLMRVASANTPMVNSLNNGVVTVGGPAGNGVMRGLVYKRDGGGCMLYGTGGFSGTATFGSTNLATAQTSCTFLTAFNTQTLAYNSAILPFTHTGANEGYAVTTVTGAPYVYITGYFRNTIQFGGAQMTASGTRDIYTVSAFVGSPVPCSGILHWTSGITSQRKAGSPYVEPANSLGQDIGWGIATDGTNLYVTGAYGRTSAGVATFDALNLTTVGQRAMFLACYPLAANGLLNAAVWLGNIDSPANASFSLGFAVTTDPFGGVYVTGQSFTLSTVTGTATTNDVNLTGSSGTTPTNDGFVCQYRANGQLCWADRIVRNSCGMGVVSAAYSIAYAACKLAFTGSYNNGARFGHLPTATSWGGSENFMAQVEPDLTIPYGASNPTATLLAYINNGTATVPLEGVSCSAATWNWTGAGLTGPTTANPTATLTTPNVSFPYGVTMTSVNGCTQTGNFIITTSGAPGPAGGDFTLCPTNTPTVIGNPATPGWTYSWAAPTGGTLSSTTIAQPTATGLGDYTLIAMDGCGVIYIDVMSLLNGCRIANPQPGRLPALAAEYDIFPNPSTGEFTIQNEDAAANTTIEVFDVLGKSVYKKQFVELRTERIDFSGASVGIYYVHINNGSGVNQVFKIVKE